MISIIVMNKKVISQEGLYVVNKLGIGYALLVELRAKFSQIQPHGKKRSFSIWSENSTHFCIPRQFGLRVLGKPDKVLLTRGTDLTHKDWEYAVQPWDFQLEAIEAIMADYNKGNYGSILNIRCAGGKTLTSLALIPRIGKKTLVVLDHESRYDPWKKELNFLYKKPPVTHLLTTKSSWMNPEADIYFAVYKSLAMGKFTDFHSIGFVIIDEVHQYITEENIKLFRYVSRQYILGLSATITRPDRLEYLLEDYIGPISFSYQKPYLGATPVVHKIIYKSTEPEKYCVLIKDPNVNYMATMRLISEDPSRLDLIMKLIKRHYHSPDDTILVLGLFRKQLEILHTRCKSEGMGNVGLYYSGNTSQDQLEKKVILAIRQLGAQGLNVEKANVMILSSSYLPQNEGESTESIEQQTGRILRLPHTESPIIYDIVDNWGFFVGKHWPLRKEFYETKNFNIV